MTSCLRVFCDSTDVAILYSSGGAGDTGSTGGSTDGSTGHKQIHKGDAGLDLFCPKEIIIPPGKTAWVDMGVVCQMVEKNAETETGELAPYFLFPRSSISITPLMLANHVGIIDAEYTGKIIAAFRNLGDTPYKIERGNRLVQICARNLAHFTVKVAVAGAAQEKEDEMMSIMKSTGRGSGGFGSTGK
jgi:dUTP pyrophosphatase